jgi:hypothetical protein
MIGKDFLTELLASSSRHFLDKSELERIRLERTHSQKLSRELPHGQVLFVQQTQKGTASPGFIEGSVWADLFVQSTKHMIRTNAELQTWAEKGVNIPQVTAEQMRSVQEGAATCLRTRSARDEPGSSRRG